MNDTRIRIRLNKTLGELEIEAPAEIAAEWWEKLRPELREQPSAAPGSLVLTQSQPSLPIPVEDFPEVFGEFFSEFPTHLTDIDKVLIAGAFAQTKDSERSFTTKAANQLLMDQNIKVTNASECVRRLTQTKRAFVISGGRFRISAMGFEHLHSLKSNP